MTGGEEGWIAGASRSTDVAAAAQLACLLEASAPKPGNVSPGRHFADATFEDFLASAAAIGGPFGDAGIRPVGATIRLAVEAASRWTLSNTNLGIVLLLAPLARAASLLAGHGAAPEGRTAQSRDGVGDRVPGLHLSPAVLRETLRRVLDDTTVEDARDVYASIRRAAPGGLGRSDVQDVAEEPSMSLLEVMRLAADRDGIAREYATAFRVTFEEGVPALSRARRDGLSWSDAVVDTFVRLLAAHADTHVARRAGADVAADVSGRAAAVVAAGGVRTASGRRTIEEMDRALRNPHRHVNPGTTADLTAAAIFVVLLGGGWRAGLS